MKPSTSAAHKRKRFVEHYVLHNSATKAAIAAGYSKKTAGQAGHRLLNDVEIVRQIDAIKSKQTDDTIATLTERKRILTEIMRARLTHFGTAGVDGFVLNVGPENLNSAGLGEIQTRTEITGQGGKAEDRAIVTKIKLRDPAQAIDLLNKMEGIYIERREHTGPDGQPLGPTIVILNGLEQDAL
jgi:phage terminase small subunit